MKLFTLSLILILFISICSPDNAIAGTSVTVYFAGGIVMGGVAIFFVFIGGERHSKKEEKKEDKENLLAEKYALNTKSTQFTEDGMGHAGMVKILEW